MSRINRRTFGKLVFCATFAMYGSEAAPAKSREYVARGVNLKQIKLEVNGTGRQVTVDTRTTLLDMLRHALDLTGSKKGCDHGQCGACTVLVNGERVKSCLSFAVMHEGDKVTTIEGLEKDGLHPMQQAFLDCDGFQCGYCTPGQIMSAVGLMREPCGKSDDEVRECMSGNICRCGAYPYIVQAVQKGRAS